ncbi:flavin monoamine oxidase family protein [Kiloniella sp. b19]|uniref:flavin monoamine oxidase family protein n=1 Tax=Kiloniella sp. GXU_MW_B19 TaxID=3141326 RepID=UPI0031CFAB08
MTTTRRSALKIMISAFLTSLAFGQKAQALSGTRVVVIGAGIAGLGAAQQLKASGAEVIVLEAGHSIGGRIRTDHSLGAPFEYGAGWIHGPSSENPIQQLVRETGTPTFVTDDDSLEIFKQNGAPLEAEGYEQLDDLYNQLQKALYFHLNSQSDHSLIEAVRDHAPDIANTPLGRWMLTAYTEFDIGAAAEDVSAANSHADEVFEGEDVILTEGYDSILAPLARGLDIRLNSPVSRVSWNDRGITVDTLSADYAICTAPLGVLKADTITFEPRLPQEMQQAIAELGFGSVTKIALKFREPFWDPSTQYFGIQTEPGGRWPYWLNYRTFSDENILLGLSFGKYAPLADSMTRDEMTADALAVLETVWGKAVTSPEAVLTTHWSEYPHFLGAYSYPQKGGSTGQFDVFATPVGNRLFMAGEHTIFAYHSTTHGALMSGRRAARAIEDLH